MVWIAVHDRLATGDRLKKWNPQVDSVCPLCNNATERRDHLFFSCHYSAGVWKNLVGKLMGSRYTTVWNIMSSLVDTTWSSAYLYILRYAFQATVHSLWRERNGRKHGEPSRDQAHLSGFIDKLIRNRIDSLRGTRNGRFDKYLQLWFANH